MVHVRCCWWETDIKSQTTQCETVFERSQPFNISALQTLCSCRIQCNSIHSVSILYITNNAKLVNWWITPVCVEIPHLYVELITYILHISQGYFGIDGVWFLDQIPLILELWSHKALLPNAEEIITKCLSLLKFAKMLLYASFDEVHWRNTGPTD